MYLIATSNHTKSARTRRWNVVLSCYETEPSATACLCFLAFSQLFPASDIVLLFSSMQSKTVDIPHKRRRVISLQDLTINIRTLFAGAKVC